MSEPYQLEKALWTSDDFERMGWHDARVWAMTACEEVGALFLDLDYIFLWVAPERRKEIYRFWVAPVTMVFKGAFEIEIDIKSQNGAIQVDDLHRTDPRQEGANTSYRFEFKCHEGAISLRAADYQFYVRSKPRLISEQWLSLEERGGISVERRAVEL